MKFRHQHPAGEFSLDFFCSRHRLCVEVDGEAHSRGDQPDFDAERDAWLTQHKVRTLRIPATDILADLEGVVRHIVTVASG